MAPAPIIGENDFQQIFADALASFSPLATLVGSDSARSLTHHVSNIKQTCAASIAPIGGLGMMATVCKGSKLSGLKDILGAGEADISDACAELGCGALYGVVPRLSHRGGLSSERKDFNRGISACAILRIKWRPGARDMSKQLDFNSLSKLLGPRSFSSGTISGRLIWETQDPQSQYEIVSLVEQKVLRSWNGEDWDMLLMDSFNDPENAPLNRGKGTVELHWPAPAMPLETNASIVILFLAGFLFVTLLVVFISASPLLRWQSITASALLLGGQILLAGGHVAAQWIIKNQRRTIYIDIPRNGLADTWMLVDNTWFTSKLARRPVSYHAGSPNHLRIGQHLSMKRNYIPTWHALLTLLAIGMGFVAFYVGVRSSNLYLILIYILLFFVANVLKGGVVSRANKGHVTSLNNPGFPDVVKKSKVCECPPCSRRRSPLWKWHKDDDNVADTSMNCIRNNSSPSFDEKNEKFQENIEVVSVSKVMEDVSYPHNSGHQSVPMSPLPESHSIQSIPNSQLSHPANIPLPPSRSSTSTGSTSSSKPPTAENTGISYRVYTKFALRHSQAIGMFYFSSPQAWGMAAHVIYEALHGLVPWQPHVRREPLLYLPFEFNDGLLATRQSNDPSALTPVSGVLLLAIDETRHEDVFWSAGMEFVSIVMGMFGDETYLCSESELATDIGLVGMYVYFVTRMILRAGRTGESGPGVVSMMRAIDLIRVKYPFDTSEFALPLMRGQAIQAVRSVIYST